MKSFFILFSLCSLWAINLMGAQPVISTSVVKIELTGDFDFPDGIGQGHRSVSGPPILASLYAERCIELDFNQIIGEIEIIISQNGIIVYSSVENIESVLIKNIYLPDFLLGNCLIEIIAKNGAYVNGSFEI